jgi:alkylation response protein AidB-like acyl-CoA dehydrogenase
MDLTPSESQRMLRESVERFVGQYFDSVTRRQRADVPGKGHWKTFAELGWLGIPFAEDEGGFGGSAVEVGIVMEEFGRGLVSEPYLATVLLGGGLIEACGSLQQRRELLPRIAQGDLRLSFAHYEADPRRGLDVVGSTARGNRGRGWKLDGWKTAVLDAATADFHVVSARGASGSSRGEIALFLVPRGATGLDMKDSSRLGGGRVANLTFDGVMLPPGARLGIGDALPAIEMVVDRALAALSAEAVGLMRAVTEATIEYTKQRVQFGRALASNQVIRHRLADMYVACDEARSMALRAALLVGQSGDSASRALAASGTKAKVGRCAMAVAEEAVQLHGAMGVTDELDIGLYFKRLMAFETMFGGSDYHLQRHAGLMTRAGRE